MIGDGKSCSTKIAPPAATPLRSGSVCASLVQKKAVSLPYLSIQGWIFSATYCCAPGIPISVVGSGALSEINSSPRSLQASSMIALLRAKSSIDMCLGKVMWANFVAPISLAAAIIL